MNWTLLRLERPMLLHKNIFKCLLPEALSTAIYVRNRLTSQAFPDNETSLHSWNGFAPVLAHLHAFCSKRWYAKNGSK